MALAARHVPDVELPEVGQLRGQLDHLAPAAEQVAGHVYAARVGTQSGNVTSFRHVLVMNADLEETIKFPEEKFNEAIMSFYYHINQKISNMA